MTVPVPAVLLDRDGTIIVDTGYLSDPDGVAFEHGAIDGLRALAAMGLPLVVVTNQSGIARGRYDMAAAIAVNARIERDLQEIGVAIAGWYICPHGPDDVCDCRKPRPGMALAAERDLGLDLARCWVIGDKLSDIDLADAVGASAILVTTGEGVAYAERASGRGIPVCASLVEAARLIGAHVDYLEPGADSIVMSQA